MVVNDFDVVGIAISPRETDAPLVVDPDAVCSCTVALQRFQMIPRWRLQVFQPLRLMKVQQLAACRALDRLKTPDELILEQSGGLDGSERPYQTTVYDAASIMSNVIDLGNRNAAGY